MTRKYLCLIGGHLLASLISSIIYSALILCVPFLRGLMTELIWAVVTQAVAISLISNCDYIKIKDFKPGLLWAGLLLFVAIFFASSYFFGILYGNIFSL